MALTFTAINAAKPKTKPYKLADGAGLYLLVLPSGGRSWRMNYRFDKKQKTLSFGQFPYVSLAKAREKCFHAHELLAEGHDPMEARKEKARVTHAKAHETFKLIAEEWVERLEREGRAHATMEKTRWLLDFAYPQIGDRPIAALTAPELLAVLRKIEARGRYETANRLRGLMGTIFRYAIATGRAQRDTSFDLRGALITPKVKHRAAIIDPKVLGGLLRAIEAHEGQPIVTIALKLTPHLFVRPGELRTAEWTEFDFETAVWTIPAGKTKMRRPHKVPLSKQVLDLLEELYPMSGDGKFLFPSVRTEARCITDNTVNAALRNSVTPRTRLPLTAFAQQPALFLTKWANGIPMRSNGNWHMWRPMRFAEPTLAVNTGRNG